MTSTPDTFLLVCAVVLIAFYAYQTYVAFQPIDALEAEFKRIQSKQRRKYLLMRKRFFEVIFDTGGNPLSTLHTMRVMNSVLLAVFIALAIVIFLV